MKIMPEHKKYLIFDLRKSLMNIIFRQSMMLAKNKKYRVANEYVTKRKIALSAYSTIHSPLNKHLTGLEEHSARHFYALRRHPGQLIAKQCRNRITNIVR